MNKQYAQEQLDKIYEKLPEELQETLFSMETAESIGETCESYGIKDGRVGQVSDLVGHVLMGFLLPQEFAGVVEKEVKLPKVLAQGIARDLNRFVFYPVRAALEQLHKMEIEVPAKIVTPQPSPEEADEPRAEERIKGPDGYREPIE